VIEAEKVLAYCDALTNGQTLQQILHGTYARLSREGSWTIHATARTASGRQVRPVHPEACCWSIEGAIAIQCNQFGYCPPWVLRWLDHLLLTERVQINQELGLHPDSVFDDIGDLNDRVQREHVLTFLAYALIRAI
jgi:hypothetical protein